MNGIFYHPMLKYSAESLGFLVSHTPADEDQIQHDESGEHVAVHGVLPPIIHSCFHQTCIYLYMRYDEELSLSDRRTDKLTDYWGVDRISDNANHQLPFPWTTLSLHKPES